MVQLPRIPDGWLDGDDDQSRLSGAAARTMIGQERPAYIGIEDGVLGGVDRGTLDVFRQMHAQGPCPTRG